MASEADNIGTRKSTNPIPTTKPEHRPRVGDAGVPPQPELASLSVLQGKSVHPGVRRVDSLPGLKRGFDGD